MAAGLLAFVQVSQKPSFHRGQNVPQPPTGKHKGTATYLKSNWRDEGAPMGRLGTFMQQGFHLWAQMHKVLELGDEGKMASFGTEAKGAQSLHPWAFSDGEGTTEKPRKAAGPPKYLIFNRGQQTCQLAELGHHVDGIGLTTHLRNEQIRTHSLSTGHREVVRWALPTFHLISSPKTL